MNKTKKILILVLAFTMLGSNVYATVRINAKKASITGSSSKIKTNSNNYAKITITDGVDANRCQVYVRVADWKDYTVHKTQQRLYNGNVKDSKLSYGTNFNVSSYKGEGYRMYVQLPTTSYYNTTEVVGEFTP